MAPEQFHNPKGVGFTADLYAVGVVVFRTLTGRLPFVSRSLEAVIKMKAEQRAPVVSTMPGMPKNVLLDWFVTKAMARNPADRFQNAREMLEHWWNVMTGLEEEETTDVMRGIGRVDESYAGPLRRSMRDPYDVAAHSAPIPTYELEEDRTLRRLPSSVGVPAYATVPSIVGISNGPMTLPSGGGAPSSGSDSTVHDTAPNTEPSPRSTPTADDEDDPFDIPTRSDPNLRKLVERELELHRKRKPPPR